MRRRFFGNRRSADARSLKGDVGGRDASIPRAARDFPEESAIWSLMQLGLTMQEARDLSPDETARYLAVANGWRNRDPQTGAEVVRPGVRKATQADFDKF